MPTTRKQIDFSGQNIYIGIDVHKKHFTVSIQGEDLAYKTFNQPPDPEVLAKYLRRNYPKANYFAAYEAGFSGFWIYESLQNHGVNCIVVNPCDIPSTDKEKKQKRDALDSRKIARSLRNGELTAIYVPPLEQQQDRSLLRTRQRLIGNQTRCRNRIKGILHFYGIRQPECFIHPGTHWSKRYMDWLKGIDVGQVSGNVTLKLLLQEASGIKELLSQTDKEIIKLSREDRYLKNLKLLLTVPGIGRLTAMIILTEIGDIARFKRFDQLCAYVGLMPNIYSSGEKERTGDITKRGNGHIRSHLVESSWTAIRHDPALSLAYQQLCSRMNGNKAIIRIARKLINRIRHVLLNNEAYELSVAA